MDANMNANMNIGCNVCECKYHTDNDYCSLSNIKVVKNNSVTNASTIECTDCGSFIHK